MRIFSLKQKNSCDYLQYELCSKMFIMVIEIHKGARTHIRSRTHLKRHCMAVTLYSDSWVYHWLSGESNTCKTEFKHRTHAHNLKGSTENVMKWNKRTNWMSKWASEWVSVWACLCALIQHSLTSTQILHTRLDRCTLFQKLLVCEIRNR